MQSKYLRNILCSSLLILTFLFIIVNLSYNFKYDEIKKDTRSFENNKDMPEKTNDLNKIVLELWKDILTVSDEQKLIRPEVIIRTVKFMIQETNEDDPELIAFVKSLIQPPSTKPINLNVRNKKDFSQIGQSAFIDNVMNRRRNGFFVESGGYDGEYLSNSLFFELERNWTGILIEAIPKLYQTILSKNRNIHVINACIAGKRPFIAKFRVADALSGKLGDMSDKHIKRVEHDTNNTKTWVFVPCFPLSTILKAINIKKVDYFSLDIEGGEWGVIENINFNELDIETLTIEWVANGATRDVILNRLIANSFVLLKDDGSDIYLKKKY